jgi:hypothetical protein
MYRLLLKCTALAFTLEPPHLEVFYNGIYDWAWWRLPIQKPSQKPKN